MFIQRAKIYFLFVLVLSIIFAPTIQGGLQWSVAMVVDGESEVVTYDESMYFGGVQEFLLARSLFLQGDHYEGFKVLHGALEGLGQLHDDVSFDGIETIDLSDHDLHGYESTSVFNCLPNLNTLNISGCGLRALPPFSDSLETLIASRNNFGDPQHNPLHTLTPEKNLRVLELSGCQLFDLPDTLPRELWRLRVSGNSFGVESQRLIVRGGRPCGIDVRYNEQIQRHVWEVICQLRELKLLDVSDCELCCLPIGRLSPLLQGLNLSSNNFAGVLSYDFSYLCNLLVLEMGACKLRSLNQWLFPHSLREFLLPHNFYYNSVGLRRVSSFADRGGALIAQYLAPHEWGNLGDLIHLEVLDLTCCYLRKVPIDALSSSLRYLYMRENNMDNASMFCSEQLAEKLINLCLLDCSYCTVGKNRQHAPDVGRKMLPADCVWEGVGSLRDFLAGVERQLR